TYSIGVLKSIDGGQTWDITSLDWTIYQNRTIAKLLIHPNDPNTLFAATTYGFMKTMDGGDNWYRTQIGDIDDMEFKPGNPDVIYACTKKLYISTDGGENFTESPAQLPNNYRVQIAVTEASPEYLYFFSSRDGIYRSEDSGISFTKKSNSPTPGNQDWYDLSFAVSHVDPDEIHCGEFNTHRSLNGGQSWQLTSDWTWGNNVGYTHCDIHEMVFFGGTLYVGSDGLITKSTNSGTDWTNLTEGIGIRQFYRIGGSQSDPYKILGGSQDNGTSVLSTTFWHEWLGADGMECVVDWSDSDIVYGTSQNGNFYKSDNGGNFGSVNITQPGGGAWITPFVQHPADASTLFVGGGQVRKTTNGMMSWTTISNLAGGNINGLAIGQSDPDYLYASKEGTIYRTKNGGSNWNDISDGLPNLSITYIAVHPSDPELVAISFSGYTDGEKVYLSYDAGDHWENISDNLPNIPANCVTFYNSPDNGLYVGMDIGVYYRDKYMDEWAPYFEGLPNVIVNELEINYTINKIRAGTYGRGLWECDVLLSAPTAAFEVSENTVPTNCVLHFYNGSTGFENEFLWNFEGGTPQTCIDENPEILYENAGTFDVELIVSNEFGSDTLMYGDLISVEDGLLPEPDFTASECVICLSKSVIFEDQTQYCPTQCEWSFSPNTVAFVNGTSAASVNPEVEFLVPGDYTVSLTVENPAGSNTITKENYINAGGQAIPFSEDFETGVITSNYWYVSNEDDGKTWEIAEPDFTPDGQYAAMMNFYAYYGMNERDQLVSPAINLSEIGNPELNFKYAYAQRASQKDSLIVYISTDCGENWERIWANGPDGTGIFATSPGTFDSFNPASSDNWCGFGYGAQCVSIDLSDYTGQPDVLLMFEGFNRFGNNLYLDDIEIPMPVGIGEVGVPDGKMVIFPNPSPGIFTIQLNPEEAALVEVMNAEGMVVYQQPVFKTSIINLGHASRGLYFVKLKTEKEVYIRKLVIE
nr:T9SS type A sorting domain-containing protein [Bacteroidota bacterium]